MMCYCLHPPRNSYGKCCMSSRKVLKKWDLGFIQKRQKILSNQSIINSYTKKELEIEHTKIEILTRSESVKFLGQKISFHHQTTTEIKNRIRAAWATFRNIEKLHARSSSTAVRRRNISDYLLRSRNMDTQQRTRKNDSIDATQDVTTHHSNKKKIQKDRATRK